MCSKFLSRLDAGVVGVHPRAEVAKERRALRRYKLGVDNASAVLLVLLCQ